MTTPTPEASGEPLDLRPLKIAIGYMPCETAYQRNEQIKAWKAYDAVKTALDVASLPPAQQGEDVAALREIVHTMQQAGANGDYVIDHLVGTNHRGLSAGSLEYVVTRARRAARYGLQSLAALDARPSPPQEVAERSDPGPCWVCTRNVVTPVRVCRKCAALASVPPPQGAPEASGEALEQLAQETCAQIRGHKHAVALIHQCWTCTSVLAALRRARETGKP